MSYLPEAERAIIDMNTFGRNINSATPEALTHQMLNGHLLYYIQSFKKHGWEDELLWEAFTTAFMGWTKELFERAEPDLVLSLREHLRRHDVFIVKDGKPIAENMATAANSEEYYEWTDAELDEAQDFLADLQIEDHEPCKEQFSTEFGKVDGNQTLTYLGPPEYIVHDADNNFISTEFKQNAKSLPIEVKEVPVEAHNSVDKVERYHADLPGSTTHEAVLQMAVKTVNDTAGPNGPNTLETLDLPLNSNVQVSREKENWTEPFKPISTNGETCTVQMPHGPTNFRSTVVKPSYTEPSPPQSQARPRRGRFKGSKNKPKPEAAFDLSVAAQTQEPSIEEIATLNKRLQWQLDHLDRGLVYVPLNLSTTKIFVFVLGSFANNKDLSSQIGLYYHDRK